MADLLQGAPLPSTITTEQQQTTVPDFYTNYLQDVANLGQNAVQQGGVAGFGPLQQQAFQMAPNAAFSGAQTAGTGAALETAAGTTAAPDIVQSYMNPYTRNVVDEMSRLQQQNIQRNVLPALSGAGVGTGSFGSKRQAQATGQSLADMQANLMGQQYGALNTGYQNALSQASTDLNRQLQAGQGMGNLATQQYNIGSGGLKQLSDLGGQQQALGQAQLNYPMLQAQNLAKLFQGVTLPTGTTKQTTSPGLQGNYGLSPLQQIGTLLSGLGAISGGGSSSTGTTGTSTNTDLASKILGLPSTAVKSVTDILNSFGISFADGGQVKGYADGGTVDPTGLATSDLTQGPTQTIDEYTPNVDGILENMPQGPIMYATGSVAPTATRGDNPLPWERTNVSNQLNDFVGHLPPQFRDKINQIRQFAEQKRKQDQFNPWNRPGQPLPLPGNPVVTPPHINAGPVGATATIGNPNQGGYNPQPTTIPPQVSPAPTDGLKDIKGLPKLEANENESLEKDFRNKQLGLNKNQPNKKLNDWANKWSAHYNKNISTRI
jgi:hypothetical protein